MANKELIKEIKDLLRSIAGKIQVSQQKQTLKQCHDSAQKMLLQIDNDTKSIERLFFCHQLITVIDEFNFDPDRTKDFVAVIFPAMLKKRQAAIISHLISLALTLRHGALLDCLQLYVQESESIVFPSVPMSGSLARDSPAFCSAVISRGFFTQHPTGKQFITEWLRALIDPVSSRPDESISMNHAIRFSFTERPFDYELHLVILEIIKHRKCQPLNNHFLIDLATVVTGRTDDNSRTILKDRFAQMLIIAYVNNMCSQSNQLKNILKDKFHQDDILMRAFCK